MDAGWGGFGIVFQGDLICCLVLQFELGKQSIQIVFTTLHV